MGGTGGKNLEKAHSWPMKVKKRAGKWRGKNEQQKWTMSRGTMRGNTMNLAPTRKIKECISRGGAPLIRMKRV